MRFLSYLVALLAALTIACGQDSNGPNASDPDAGANAPDAMAETGETSGVDNKPLSEITVNEADELCAWGNGLLDQEKLLAFSCYRVSIGTTQDTEACQASYDSCVADSSDEVDTDCNLQDTLPDCAMDVDVNDFEACALAIRDHIHGYAETLSCEARDLSGVNDPPAGCSAIIDACPELL